MGCRGVKLFLLKDVTITSVATATVTTVTITTFTIPVLKFCPKGHRPSDNLRQGGKTLTVLLH